MQQHQQPVVVDTSDKNLGKYVPPPPPSLNGGLYTGQPFAPGAEWANRPVAPDAGNYQYGSLAQVASAPAAARYMMPGGGLRPGNNTPLLPPSFAHNRVEALNAIAVPTAAYAVDAPCCEAPPNRAGRREYAYL